MIYNLKANQWVDQYVTTVEPPPIGSTTSSLGVFIGVGVAAAVCIGVLLGWIVFRCRKSSPARVRTMYNQVPSRSDTPRDLQDVKAAMQWSPYEQLPRHPHAMSSVESPPWLHPHTPTQANAYSNPVDHRGHMSFSG